MQRSLPIAVTLISLLAAAARADVVPPEPTDCPVGSAGSTCHGGAHCRPAACPATGSCAAGTTCQTRSFCIERLDCGGMGGSYFVDSVKGTCGGGAGCKAGSCQAIQVCAPPAPLPDAAPPSSDARRTDVGGAARDGAPRTDGAVTPPGRGCTCSLDEIPAAASGLPAALLVVGLLLRRRRAVPRARR